jgi:hypothetical protein
MNRMQKIAWCFLVTGFIAVIMFSAAFFIIYLKYGPGKAFTAIGFLGILGVAGAAPLFIKKDSGKVTCDERDKIIHLKASRAAFGIFFIASYLLSFVAVPLLRGGNGSISVKELWFLFSIATIPFWLGWAAAILVQYGRGGEGGGQ